MAWADVWASRSPGELQPSAVDLERLDPAGWRALMSWFSGSNNNRGGSASKQANKHPRARSARRREPSPGQLSLDLGIELA